MDSGVARKPIIDMKGYDQTLAARLDPTAAMLQVLHDKVRANPKRMVFAEGEDERVIRAAVSYARSGLGEAILIGREDEVHKIECEVVRSCSCLHRLFLQADATAGAPRTRCAAHGATGSPHFRGLHARAWRCRWDGLGRDSEIRRGAGPRSGAVVARGRTVLVADTVVHEMPTGEEIANIAEAAAGAARKMGLEPRVAMTSFSTFGYPESERSENLRKGVKILEERGVDFEFDGEMAVDVALNMDAMANYPFCRLSAPANVLVMPARHSASISTKMLNEMGGSTLIGPILVGMEQPVQVASITASVSDIVTMAVFAAGEF